MRTPARARRWRPVLILAALAALLLPSVSQVAAADPVVLRVGETQDVTAINPYLATLFSDYEVFTLNYDLLVGYGPDEEPVPGFAKSWVQDGNTWTFKIDPALTWSDGTPATAEDARWTIQSLLDGQAVDPFYVGSGYLDAYLTYAGVKKVSSPDAQTLVIETETPNTQILTSYIPILPKHIWEKRKIGEDANDPPVVGTGPYQAVEWKPGEYVHLVRNPHYWGTQGYADEIFIQYFADESAMTEALKAGRSTTRATRPPTSSIPPGPARHRARPFGHGVRSQRVHRARLQHLQQAHQGRWRVDHGAPGPQVPRRARLRHRQAGARRQGAQGQGGRRLDHHPAGPGAGKWHTEPTDLRTFDIELAKQKLAAAGYTLDANGKLLDKELKPIALRMVVPDTSSTYSDSAQFITDWWKQLGIDMTTQAYDADTLTTKMLPPEGDGTADFDVFIWNWGGDVDPNSLLNNMTTGAIGAASDSFYSNPHYDELMTQQQAEQDPVKRKAIVDEMQQLVYDDAPYHVLFYDEGLHAYRTDHFGGWKLQPSADGLPFFGYGGANYTLLTAPEPAATPRRRLQRRPGAGQLGIAGTGAKLVRPAATRRRSSWASLPSSSSASVAVLFSRRRRSSEGDEEA